MTPIPPILLFVPRMTAGGGLNPLAMLALGLLAVFAAVVFNQVQSAAENEDANRPFGFGR